MLLALGELLGFFAGGEAGDVGGGWGRVGGGGGEEDGGEGEGG